MCKSFWLITKENVTSFSVLDGHVQNAFNFSGDILLDG